jgi:chemotaxis protein CheX
MSSTVQEKRTELSDAQKKFIAPFVKMTKDVFSMMLGWKVDLMGVVTNDRTAIRHDCSGIVGLSGAIRGSVVISLDQEVAISAAGAFLGERPDSINSDVIDTVGELANMVGGASKDKMGIAGISLGLPTVVTGKNHRVSFEPGAHIEMLHFSSPHGPLTVEIAVVGLVL